MRLRTRLAAVAAAATLLGAGIAAAAPSAFACSAPANCTNGTVSIGSTIGTTGFPTSFAITANAGSTGSATASAYSVFSNTTWHLSFQDDSTDLIGGTNFPALWYIAGTAAPGPDTFGITGTTTINHNGTPFNLPAGNGVTSVTIDSGGATAGGQNFADVFSVAVPTAQAPGLYQAAFQYVLAG